MYFVSDFVSFLVTDIMINRLEYKLVSNANTDDRNFLHEVCVKLVSDGKFDENLFSKKKEHNDQNISKIGGSRLFTIGFDTLEIITKIEGTWVRKK